MQGFSLTPGFSWKGYRKSQLLGPGQDAVDVHKYFPLSAITKGRREIMIVKYLKL